MFAVKASLNDGKGLNEPMESGFADESPDTIASVGYATTEQ